MDHRRKKIQDLSGIVFLICNKRTKSKILKYQWHILVRLFMIGVVEAGEENQDLCMKRESVLSLMVC